MDGNRRYAEQKSLKIVQGHTFGYQRLIQALEWCLDLGISCVSVYAFSIDNYKRSNEEVVTLMSLAEEKLSQMFEEQDVLHKHQVQVRIIGDLALAPRSVQAAAVKIMNATQHHNKAILNICLSYTSSRELQVALDRTSLPKRATNSTSTIIDDHMYTAGGPPVDILIRTSGESRLSDFMLRQSSHALLVFTRALWPEFSFLDLLHAIMQYQSQCHVLRRARQESATAGERAWKGFLLQRRQRQGIASGTIARPTEQDKQQQQQRNDNNDNDRFDRSRSNSGIQHSPLITTLLMQNDTVQVQVQAEDALVHALLPRVITKTPRDTNTTCHAEEDGEGKGVGSIESPCGVATPISCSSPSSRSDSSLSSDTRQPMNP